MRTETTRTETTRSGPPAPEATASATTGRERIPTSERRPETTSPPLAPSTAAQSGTGLDETVDETGGMPSPPLASLSEIAHGDRLEALGASTSRRRAREVASSVGKGLAAGLVGTAVMTLAQRIEMKLQHREPSKAPAQAVEKIFGIRPRDEQAEQRLAQLVHFAYGTAWGGVRGLLGSAGLGGVAAPVAHFAAISGAAAAMLPALDLAPPPSEWTKRQIATDTIHHAVYAGATNAAYRLMSR